MTRLRRRDRRFWTTVGYVLTGAWIVGILAATGGEMAHPLARYIFIVPLAGWIAGLVIARLRRGRGAD